MDNIPYQQMDMHYIPGWKDAPPWAQWVQFCTLRGWVFTDQKPHVYSDGVSSIYDVHFIQAHLTPNVVFLRNYRHYRGCARPWTE